MRWTRRGGVLAFALGGLALCVCRSEPREPALADLVRAMGDHRPTEARLTGGFGHAPCREDARKGRLLAVVECSPAPQPGTRFFKLLTRLQRRAGRNASTETLHVAGVALLVAGRDSSITNGVALLERAAEAGPADAGLLSDLAAGYITRAQRQDNPEDLVRGLDAAARAVNADPRLAEAKFNLGLALDKLFLRRSAAAAWEEYAKLDRSSPWAAEVLERIEVLRQPSIPERWERELPALEAAALGGDAGTVRRIVAIDPQLARETAVESVLGRWGKSHLADDQLGAERSLGVASAIGEALFASSGDPTVHDAVDAVRRATGLAQRLDRLAQGHVAFAQGMASFRAMEIQRAGPLLARARGLLAGSESPIELWAQVGEARCQAYSVRYPEAQAVFRSVLDRAVRAHYHALAAWCHWGLSWLQGREGRLAESLEPLLDGEALFARGRERENHATLMSHLAIGFATTGQNRAAWSHFYQASRDLSYFPLSLRWHNLLMESARTAAEQGWPEAGLSLQDEGLRAAELTGFPFRKAEALWMRSRMLSVLGREEEARKAVVAAFDSAWASNIGPPRAKLLADVARARGEVLAGTKPEESLRWLSEAIAEFVRLRAVPFAAYATLARARVYRRLGRDQEAGEDLVVALRLLEDPTAGRLDSDHQISFFESLQDIHDEWIDFLWTARRDGEASLVALEKARSLPEESPIVNLAAAVNSLPSNTTVVEYALLDQRLLVWCITNEGIQVSERNVTRQKLEKRVDTFIRVIQADNEQESVAIGSELYKLLIPDLITEAGRSGPIYFVADKELNRLPFTALRNPTSGKFLIEEHEVAAAPSLTALLRWRRGGPAKFYDAGASSALLVGDPAFDRRRLPDLERLDHAAQEIEMASRLFPGFRCLTGKAATTSEVLRELDRHEVFVFAGHAVSNAVQPSRSFLALAPSVGDVSGGILLPAKLPRRPFARLRLVVLSACTTLGPRRSRVAGLSGLALPFLERGATSVTGTLWNVSDKETSNFLGPLYSHLAGGCSAIDALRETQLEVLMASPRKQVRQWAVFQTVCGLNGGHHGKCAL